MNAPQNTFAVLPIRMNPVLQQIAICASGLQQPALPRHARKNDAASRAEVRVAWLRWLRFGGGGDWRLLKKRMRAEGLRPSSLYQPAQLAVLPDWCDTLSQVMAVAKGFNRDSLEQTLTATLQKANFSDLFAPLLVVARQQLVARTPQLGTHPDANVSDAALRDLELALLNRLAELATPCVLAMFNDFKASAPSSVAASAMNPMLAMLMPASTAAPTAAYQAFVTAQWADGYQNLCMRFPVLARLLAQALVQWAEMVAEFLQRLAHDRHALSARFAKPGQALGQVRRIGTTLSDSHAGGRTVMKVVFDSLSANYADRAVMDEVVVAYKPRPAELEAAFSDLLDWFNAHADQLGEPALPANQPVHQVPRLLCGDVDGKRYGWMEWIAAAPMADGQQAAYFWRLGSLIGLYRALNGIDLHLENAVAAGAYPVLVDVECLLHPSTQPFMQAAEGAQEVEAATATALVNMAALPIYGFSSGGIFSFGLFGNGLAQTGPDVPMLAHPNTDWMAVRRTPQDVPWQQLPQTPAGPVDARPFARDAARGYAQTLKLVLKHRDAWLSPASGPVFAMRRAHGRHLARTTSHYGALLNEALLPEAQSSGVLFDLSFEALHRHIAALPKGYQAMAPAEREDLRRLDVPRFMFDAGTRQVLDAHGQPLGECHVQIPFDRMTQALQDLTPEQVDWEASVFEHALRPPEADKGLATALGAQQLVAPDGKLVWFSLASGADGTRVKPLSLGLYAGNMGVALALASAAVAHNNVQFKSLAQRTLRQVIDDLNKLLKGTNDTEAAQAAANDEGILALVGPGFDTGCAGLLFGLQACQQMFGPDNAESDNSGYHTTVTADIPTMAACLVSDPRFAVMVGNDKRLDLLGGNAGLLLALLSWHKQTSALNQSTAFLQMAERCGQRIMALAQRELKANGEHLSWPIHSAIGLSGLSHGGSGFALAFAALYKATGNSAWLQSALAALRHEATLYSSERLNWRDLRGFTPKAENEESLNDGIGKVRYFGVGWCHGAPGIALARAALLNMLGHELPTDQTQRLQADLNVAMATNLRVLQFKEASLVDDLCCGSAGRIDILLECGRLLKRSDWVEQAQSMAQAKLAEWQNSDGKTNADDAATASPNFWYQDKALGIAGSDLGLFKGMAGWPYVAARVELPNAVPCALLPFTDLVGLA